MTRTEYISPSELSQLSDLQSCAGWVVQLEAAHLTHAEMHTLELVKEARKMRGRNRVISVTGSRALRLMTRSLREGAYKSNLVSSSIKSRISASSTRSTFFMKTTIDGTPAFRHAGMSARVFSSGPSANQSGRRKHKHRARLSFESPLIS